jgi:hypothetical protein
MAMTQLKRLLAVCAWLSTAACSNSKLTDRPLTQLVVAVNSDYVEGVDLQNVSLETTRFDGLQKSATLQLGTPSADGHAAFPFSFGVPAREQDIGQIVTISVSGFGLLSSPIVRQVVRTGFVRGKTLLLQIDLSRSCADRYAFCEAEDNRCRDGLCVSSWLDPATLPEVVVGKELGDLTPIPEPVADGGTTARGQDASTTASSSSDAGEAEPPMLGSFVPTTSASIAVTSEATASASTSVTSEATASASTSVTSEVTASPLLSTNLPQDASGGDAELADAGASDVPDASASEPEPDASVSPIQCDPDACNGCVVGELHCRGAERGWCDTTGIWTPQDQCFSGCEESPNARCLTCTQGAAACSGSTLLTCQPSGVTNLEPCSFGCWEPTPACGERTPAGIALINMLITPI